MGIWSARQTSPPRHPSPYYFLHDNEMAIITVRHESVAEQQMQHALTALDKDPNLSICTTENIYGVLKTTLANRFRSGTKSR